MPLKVSATYLLKSSILIGFMLCMSSLYAQHSLSSALQVNQSNHTEDSITVFKLIRKGQRLNTQNSDSALLLYKKAEMLSKERNYEYGTSFALMAQALVHATITGNETAANNSFQEALTFCLKIPKSDALPTLYFGIGSTWAFKNNWENANLYFHKSLNLLVNTLPSHRLIPVLYSNLSAVQYKLGNYNKTLQYAFLAAEILGEQQEKFLDYIPVIINVGHAYSALKQFDSAQFYLKKGLLLAREKKHKVMQQSLLTLLGDLMMEQNKTQEAIDFYKQSLQIKTTHVLYGSIAPGYSLGRAYYTIKEYALAEKTLKTAIALADSTGFNENKHLAYKTLSAIYETTGKYYASLKAYKLYNLLQDSITGIEKIKAISEVETKFQTEQKDKIIAENKLHIEQQQSKLQRSNIITLAITIIALLIVIIIVIYYRLRQKNIQREKVIERLRANMEGEENERKRMARELHDGVGGLLTSTKLSVESIQHKPMPSQNDINHISDLLEEMGEELYRTAHNLMPEILEEQDLWYALSSYCEHIERTSQIQIRIQTVGDIEVLDKEIALPIYRIAQELIQNTIKHAKATELFIQLHYEKLTCKFILLMEDNGIGFDANVNHKGMGLNNIKERVNALNGFISIESTQQMGTTVYIEINIKKQ